MPEIIDPLFAPAVPTPTDPTVSGGPAELEILAARRAFATAQFLLSGSPILPVRTITTGWHDSSVSEQGSFAVIALDSGLDDLVGEIIQVVHNRRRVFAYVLEAVEVPTPLSLARRPFLWLHRLNIESLDCKVAVIG